MNCENPAQQTATQEPQIDHDLGRILDERYARQKNRNRRINFILLALLGLVCVGGGVYYQTNPALQTQVHELIKELKDGRKDFALAASPLEMKKTFDKSLAKISTRKGDIENAAISVGVDPSKVAEDGMDSEMRDMMGGEGRTISDRNKQLRDKIGTSAAAQVKHQQAKDITRQKEGMEKAARENAPAATRAPVKPAAALRPVAHQEELIIE